ncbi:Mns1, partial [Symbiodinium sp. CCMP2592]
QNLHAVHGESDVHVEVLRRQRMQLDERQERLFDFLYVKAEQEKENRRQIAEFEELLAEELARRKAQQVRKEVVRQQVCNQSEELRALKEKLQAAQVNKVRARQLMEKQDRERSEQEQQGAHDALVEDTGNEFLLRVSALLDFALRP